METMHHQDLILNKMLHLLYAKPKLNKILKILWVYLLTLVKGILEFLIIYLNLELI